MNGPVKVWMCGKRYQEKGKKGCTSKTLYEKDLHRAFLMAWNAILENREDFLEGWQTQAQGNDVLAAFRAKQFMQLTKDTTPLQELDFALVSKTLEHCTIEPLGVINFYFLDGTELGIEIED